MLASTLAMGMPRVLRVLAAFASVAATLACAQSAAAITGPTTLSYTGAEQTYTVPSGVTLVVVEAQGAAGGCFDTTGFGMNLNGYLPVSPGQTLYGEVGASGSYEGGEGFGGGGAAGNFPREYLPGFPVYPPCTGPDDEPPKCGGAVAGSGGGASDLRTCARAASSCPAGGSSDESRLLVAGGGGGVGGDDNNGAVYCTVFPDLGGNSYNDQNPLPAGNAAEGPLPIATSTGTLIPGTNSLSSAALLEPPVSAARGGAASPGAGGSLSTCEDFGVSSPPELQELYADSQPGSAAVNTSGGAGASTTGFAPKKVIESGGRPIGGGAVPGAGGGGGGGYTGGGGGSSGYECTFQKGSPECAYASTGMAGAGGSSFAANQVLYPFVGENKLLETYNGANPHNPGWITITPVIELGSPSNGATYTLGQLVIASWSCAKVDIQEGSCEGTTPSGSPIETASLGKHTFTVSASTGGAPLGVRPLASSVTYTVVGQVGPPPQLSLSEAHLTHGRFRVSKRQTAISAKAHPAPLGTAFDFTLSASARVDVTIEHSEPGLRSHGKCVAASAALRRAHARSCTRTVTDGKLTRANEASGADSIPFSGRIANKPLGTGTYKAILTANNAVAEASAITLTFAVVG